MSEPTIEEQLAIVTNSRNALLLSTDQLYKENQKALADHATALQAVQTDLATKTTELATATQAKTTLETQVATLTEQLSTSTTQLSSATTELSTLEAKVSELEATVVELTPPPKPESVTPAQIRLWLIANGISLDTVEQMIAAIPDDTTRAAAQVRWEYGLVVLRDDPLVQQMGTALGFTTEQMDTAFLAASQIT